MHKSTMLSITSKYALRALSHLASLPEGSEVLGREISRSAGVPGNYLSKILLVLRNAGFLETQRGKGGGYRLQKQPRKIHLHEVVELFENLQTKPACLLGQNQVCSEESPCLAHSAWSEVHQAYLQFLNSTTIADISKSPSDQRMEQPKRATKGSR